MPDGDEKTLMNNGNENQQEEDEDEDEEEEDFSNCMEAESAEEAQKGKEPLWNMFKTVSEEEGSISMADTTFVDLSISLLKIIAYVVTFCGVLFGATFAKSGLLLMTSQLTPNRNVSVINGGTILTMPIPDEERFLWIWALLLSFAVPELGTFIRSIRYILFKSHTRSDQDDSWKAAAIVLFSMETLHVIGMAIFVFEILPQVDAIRGAMLTNCVCLVPAILVLLSNKRDEWKRVADAVAILMQISGYVLWPLVGDNPRLWFLPPALLMISCGWWANFVMDNSKFGIVRILFKVKEKLKNNDILLYRQYAWLSLYKVTIFVLVSCLILQMQGIDLSNFFDSIDSTFSDGRTMDAYELKQVPGQPHFYVATDEKYEVPTVGSFVWWIIGSQVLAAYLSYGFSKFACKIMISSVSFAVPVIFVVPATIAFIQLLSEYREENLGDFKHLPYKYLTFYVPDLHNPETTFIDQFGWVWIFWVISQVWITSHIWSPKCDRLSRTEKLFATPMYSDFLVDQSVAMNRRRDEAMHLEGKPGEQTESDGNNVHRPADGYPPHIIACATMWHESKPEMLEMLKSIVRMDLDYCMRESARENLKNHNEDSNSYTFETHIFFDDAFEIENESTGNMIMNSFVHHLMESVPKAIDAVYENQGVFTSPQKMATPYGGRLIYTLPGRTMLYVHLKDKDKIRHRKRWSQVMYMYYLLGYNLMEESVLVDKDVADGEQAIIKKKLKKADSTFLLALDGDIDFKPQAVFLLVDLMKKNSNLGAACGRIHPVGSGFMVWYQMFEYAIGHWLQKATEHMIGCVLCSPGCFSLFRARALMDDNVMRKYTTKAEEPQHYVQYDQGEDRWLCTLLLQRGYRVEYCAASDAYTHCPESFNEFYTQRRRWVPSTMANLVDLLSDYKKLVKINNDISWLYVIYQGFLLLGTVLGPGTIFLLLVSAFNAAFKIDNWSAFYYNTIPILLYVVICLLLTGKVQLLSAMILSGIYGLIMMAVLVGMLMQITDDGLLAPSSMFFFTVAGEIIIAGLIHPREIFCLFCGPIYYVTIPSMYLLLMIYSVCNLNIVTWGTREVKQKKTKAELEEEKKAAEEAKKKGSLQNILGSFGHKSMAENEGSFELSVGDLFKCMLCTRPKVNQTQGELVKMNDTLDKVKKRLEGLERSLECGQPLSRIQRSRRSSMDPYDPNNIIDMTDLPEERPRERKSETEDSTQGREEDERDDLKNPYWIEDKSLKKSKLTVMSINEINFWKELIKKYLAPLLADKEKEAKVSKALKDLRDKMVVTFFMLNALFVTVVFLLQLNKKQIFIKWPLDPKINITIDANKEIHITKTNLQLEPVGVIFVLFFAIILVIQFGAMFFHRFETLSHLLSSSPLLPWKKKIKSFELNMKIGKQRLMMDESDSGRQEETRDFRHKTDIMFSKLKHELDREMAEKRQSTFKKWIGPKAEPTSSPFRHSVYRNSKRLERVSEEDPES